MNERLRQELHEIRTMVDYTLTEVEARFPPEQRQAALDLSQTVATALIDVGLSVKAYPILPEVLRLLAANCDMITKIHKEDS